MIPIRRAWPVVGLLVLALGLPAQVPSSNAAPTPPKASGAAGSPDEVPSSLEGMVEKAIAANPEVLVAEAKLRQAEAELNLVRMRIVQEVTEAHARKQSCLAKLAVLREAYLRVGKLAEAGNVSTTEVAVARAALVDGELDLAKLEATTRLLLGIGGNASPGSGRNVASGPFGADSKAVERDQRLFLPVAIADLLNKPMAECVELSLDDIAAVFRSEGVNVVFSEQARGLTSGGIDGGKSAPPVPLREVKIRLELAAGTPIRAALGAFCDVTGWAVAYRQYGIFIGYGHEAGPRETWIAGPQARAPSSGK